MRSRQVSSIRLGFHRGVTAEPQTVGAPARQPGPKASREITVFLDRDGVLVRDRTDYVKSWSEVEIVPGSLEALGRLRLAGARIFVATNQSAVGRGVLPREALDDIHARLARIAVEHGAWIDGFLVCPHRPDDGCGCRKPRPGLLLQAQRAFNLELFTAFMVGDQVSDALAAGAVGCTAILVGDQPPHVRRRWRVARSLAEAVDLILEASRLDS